MTAATPWLLWLTLMAASVLPAQAQEVFYIHTDALGSVVAETDANGNVVKRSEYEPYGRVLNRPVTNGPGYTGHVEDAATGLTYMQQRYYDPGIGRMLSVDPVTAYDNGDYRFFNRYAYAFNNPYKFTDPDGRCPVCPAIIFFVLAMTESGNANAPAPGERTSGGSSADALAAVPGGGTAVRGIRTTVNVVNKATDRTPIQGKAQVTKADGKETTHASTSQRIANQEAGRPDAASVHMNQRISTVTNGEVNSSLRGDVATVRKDGKVDVTEVLSPRQEAGATANKYQSALGERAGTIKCVPQDGC